MEKIITFSVAAYNVENYLEKLMTSLLNSETAEFIEVLVVNDGSTDKTAEIAEKYVKNFPDTVRLINKQNGGHGSTINRGIEEASGKYFKAIDGDDWVDSSALAKLIVGLKTTSADMIVTNYRKCFSDGREEDVTFSGLADGREYEFDEAAAKAGRMSYHSVIFKTDILKRHHIRLDEKCFYVDTEYILFPVPYLNSVFYFDIPLYCYRLGETGQSVSPVSRIKHCADSYRVSESLFKFYGSGLPEMSERKNDYILFVIGGHCAWHLYTLILFRPSAKNKRNLIDFENEIRNNHPEIYREMEQLGDQSRIIKSLRRSKYVLYYPISWYKQIKEVMKCE